LRLRITSPLPVLTTMKLRRTISSITSMKSTKSMRSTLISWLHTLPSLVELWPFLAEILNIPRKNLPVLRRGSGTSLALPVSSRSWQLLLPMPTPMPLSPTPISQESALLPLVIPPGYVLSLADKPGCPRRRTKFVPVWHLYLNPQGYCDCPLQEYCK